MNVEQITGSGTDYRQVKVVIGGDGKKYDPAQPHFEVSACQDFGNLMLLLPDSVAEYFRREGRRQLQAELRASLNSARA